MDMNEGGEDWAEAKELVNNLRSIPKWITVLKDRATNSYNNLDEKQKKGQLPEDLETEFLAKKQELLDINNELSDFLETWRTNHPYFSDK